MREKAETEQLTVFINPELKQAFRLECVRRKMTMTEAIEGLIMEMTATKPVIKQKAA